MRFTFLLSLALLVLDISAQPEPKATSFHFEFDLLATLPTMVKEENGLDNRFERGAGLSFSIRRKISPLVSLEAGVGAQLIGVRQRRENLLFGCNLPPVFGGTDAPDSYLDARIELNNATLHFAPVFHLERDRDGLYLKPKLRFNYNIGSAVNGSLHECSRDEGTAVYVGDANARKLTVYPGFGFGYQMEGERGKFSYIEVNLAASASSTFSKVDSEDEFNPLFEFWRESGALIGGITIGFQIGGGEKKDRRPKKEQPKLVPGFYTGR